MYDETLLQVRMAELGFNYHSLSKKAKVDGKTAKSFVTTGRGIPRTVKRIAKALQFELPEIVKRQNGNRKTA